MRYGMRRGNMKETEQRRLHGKYAEECGEGRGDQKGGKKKLSPR